MTVPRVYQDVLAIHGGRPVREVRLSYGHQSIDEEDIASVVEALGSDWLTTGPRVDAFEEQFAAFVGAREAVAVSNGTAALHAAVFACDIGPGDEVIVPAMTFAATANCVVFQGGMPVFADINLETLLIDPANIESKITSHTKAIIAMDYAGQPCDYDVLRAIAQRHGLLLIADACHALGATYKSQNVGTLADLSTFSFHPVKHITTGEGGMVTTDDLEMGRRMRSFRNHGITSDHREREQQGSWFYEMAELGYNYRITDVQCALGISQLHKLPDWLARRRDIARCYDEAMADLPGVAPLGIQPDVCHAYHLYVVRIDPEQVGADRGQLFEALRAEGLGVNVHYIPVHLHPFYRRRFGTGPGDCPVAEAAYEQILSLPIFPGMGEGDVEDVITALNKVCRAFHL